MLFKFLIGGGRERRVVHVYPKLRELNKFGCPEESLEMGNLGEDSDTLEVVNGAGGELVETFDLDGGLSENGSFFHKLRSKSRHLRKKGERLLSELFFVRRDQH